MAYPVAGYPDLSTSRPQGTSAQLDAGNIDLQDVNKTLLGDLETVAQKLGKTINIFSGYRTDKYSAAVGGFAGDPHSRGIAVDAGFGAVPEHNPIGSYPGAVEQLHALGLGSGATDFTYHGQTDPSHVDLLGPSRTGSANVSAPATSTVTPISSQAGKKVPGELAQAIAQAAEATGVPADILTGIWIREDGAFPNPFTNGSGYGGLFGTPDKTSQGAPFDRFNETASTQQQANLEASILASNIRSAKGSVSDGLYAYSGHSYTTVPGETSFGTLGNLNPGVNVGSGASAGTNAGDSGIGIGDVAHYAALPFTAQYDAASGVVSGVFSGVDSVSKFLNFIVSVRFLELAGGFVLAIVGLIILARPGSPPTT